ncbi:MAG: hypothetical protein KDA79_14765, partial [Planctomycetaceae bacterium]|nr:hypothetical protein [Planctomycetaceae bacterium]
MLIHAPWCRSLLCLLAVFCVGLQLLQGEAVAAAAGQTFASHPPARPLPVAAARPLPEGTVRYVDAARGNDTAAGTEQSPWKTLGHAVSQLHPGETLCLRGGVYYEHCTVQLRGTESRPCIIRSYPGELAVIDGGLPEFQQSPEMAWEPVKDGAPNEFRSVREYPEIDGTAGGTVLLGRFADSLIPLHGYRYLEDLRSSNEYFSRIEAGKTEAGSGIYCGPGVYFNQETRRIHIRLSHTRQAALGDDNYRGETDPRKLKLIIASAADGSPLALTDSRHVRVQDIVVRGARTAAISIAGCANLEFDHVTALGGSAAFGVTDTAGLRVVHCACRGIAAPWTYRGSLKYRAIEARIFSASSWQPTGRDNRDFELAYSEFTDCVDGVFLGNCRNVKFHHNLVDNVSDDGMFLTAGTAYDGTTPGGNLQISQNLFRRCLTVFAFGVGHGRQKMTATGRQTGSNVFICRNVFDFRRPVMYTQPEEGETEWTSFGRVAGDHGGPLWEPMTIYHNTVLAQDPPFRAIYAAGFGGHMAGGSRRSVFNNLFVQFNGQMGSVLPPVVLPVETASGKSAGKGQPQDDPLGSLLDGDLDSGKTGKPKFSKDVDQKAVAKLKAGAEKPPAAPLPIEFRADGNLHWSLAERTEISTLLKRFRSSEEYERSRAWYPAGWTTNDVAGDPQFARLEADWTAPLDLRLNEGSPAVNAGVPLPEDWADPLRGEDGNRPDIGALPAGADVWQIGQRGRLDAFGQPAEMLAVAAAASTKPVSGSFLLPPDQLPPDLQQTKVALMTGYPAFDEPLIRFAFHSQGHPVELFERTWLPPRRYREFDAVIVAGDLARAKMEPNRYSVDDLPYVRQYLENGGTLILLRGNFQLFNTPAGRRLQQELLGNTTRAADGDRSLLLPKHPFVQHLDPDQPHPWINARNVVPVRASGGQSIIGSGNSVASLLSVPAGKGRLVYVGWDVA